MLDDSSKRLKDLADKLLGLVKIAVNSGTTVALLPHDAIDKRSGARAQSSDSDAIDGSRNEPLCKRMKIIRHVVVQMVTKKQKPARTGTSSAAMFSKAVPVTAASAANLDRTTSNNTSFSTTTAQNFGKNASVLEEETVLLVPSLITIFPEDDGSGIGSTLVAHIVTVGSENDWTATLPLPMKLPSIAMVDVGAAAEFASNIFDRIYLETRNDVMSLKLEDDGEK
jgi:hypothetical protein